MLNFATLDLIADLYLPLLGVACVAALALAVRRGAAARPLITLLALGMLATYGWMALDWWLGIWPALGMDYSTHTALGLVLVLFVWRVHPGWRGMAVITLLTYCVLMRYQRYHTFADMITTLIVVGATYWPLSRFIKER